MRRSSRKNSNSRDTLLLGIAFVALLVAFFTVFNLPNRFASDNTTPSEARGPGGGGGGKGGKTQTCKTCVLTYSPNPMTAGQRVTIYGSSYGPNVWLNMGFLGWQDWTYVQADSQGNFSYTYPNPISVCGTLTWEVIQNTIVATIQIPVTGCAAPN